MRLTRNQLLKRMEKALKKIEKEISGNSRGGFYGSGLSAEGYAGGYRDALHDVDALLRHGYPNDTRGYWRTEEEK